MLSSFYIIITLILRILIENLKMFFIYFAFFGKKQMKNMKGGRKQEMRLVQNATLSTVTTVLFSI